VKAQLGGTHPTTHPSRIYDTVMVSGSLSLYYKGEKIDTGRAQDSDFHGYGVQIRARLTELIPNHEDVQVLDVGTGMASTAKFLLQHLSKRSQVLSLDPSEDILTKARNALSAEDQQRITFMRGSADDLKFGNESFDIVVSVMVMHHIEAVGESIAEMSRVLRQGGRLIIVDYSPEAHTLDFQSRHNEDDFFESDTISEAVKASHLKPRVENHGKWYLVEATRTSGTE
jgi:ubiquinone/menaquinone biosynthesis C-methylase UbiE